MGREQWERDIWSMFENKTLDKYSSVINMVVRRGIVGMHAAELSQARRDIATSKAQASTPICCSFWNCVLSHYQKKKREREKNCDCGVGVGGHGQGLVRSWKGSRGPSGKRTGWVLQLRGKG